jgi:hypothetical protein
MKLWTIVRLVLAVWFKMRGVCPRRLRGSRAMDRRVELDRITNSFDLLMIPDSVRKEIVEALVSNKWDWFTDCDGCSCVDEIYWPTIFFPPCLRHDFDCEVTPDARWAANARFYRTQRAYRVSRFESGARWFGVTVAWFGWLKWAQMARGSKGVRAFGWLASIGAWFRRLIGLGPSAPAPAPVVAPSSRTVLVAYEFFQHNTDNENTYRAERLQAAREMGATALAVVVRTPPNHELAMHLLHFEHPDRPGYFLGSENWYNRARAAGICAWVLDVSRMAGSWEELAFLFKAYAPGEVQYVGIDPLALKKASKILGCDDEGVKITAAYVKG